MDAREPSAQGLPELQYSSDACLELAAALEAHVAAQFGPREEQPFAFLARDPDGTLAGGLNGVCHWRWCYVRHLFVAESRRSSGLGRRLLAAAEDLARTRGCAGVYLDTFDAGARAFYLRLGYRVCGRIEGFPPGHCRTFLAKHLDPNG